MYPNLEAEQARNGHTNTDVAKILNLSRQSYEARKRKGNFKLVEVKKLTAMYKVTCEYLFSEEQERPSA